jgi:4-diphosphocytidyl-2-C-methyl-D-erythritol kinase
VIRLLQRAWPKAEQWMLAVAAASTGSDVTAIADGGTVFAFGRGEMVLPCASELPEHGVVLFVPPESLEKKTARMFAALDGLPADDGSIVEALQDRLPCQLRGADIYNAFERVAFDMFPGLAELWDDLETRIGEPIHLAGAGPTMFWIGPTGEARGVAARAQGLPCTVIETRTSPSLWRR